MLIATLMIGGLVIGMLLVLPHYRPRAAKRASALGHALPVAPSVLRETNGMVWIPPGTFSMGSREGGPEERPVHDATVEGFWMDRHEVTNEEFRKFVEATGYRTVAERQYATNSGLGGLVGRGMSPGPVGAMAWRVVPGADWKHPLGADSTIEGLGKHPVVQVAWEDAQAYAQWAGKRLPSEAEWERAARGGFERQRFVWGGERLPGGLAAANFRPSGPSGVPSDAFEGTAPVGSFAANGFGVFDVAGNVAEWTADEFVMDAYAKQPANQAPATTSTISLKAIRGGSFLSDLSDCRPAWRAGHPAATPRSDLGFRCVRTSF